MELDNRKPSENALLKNNIRRSYNGIQDDIIKWKHFPRYWPFVRVIHQSPVNYPHKGHAGTQRFDVFFDLRPNKRLIKQWRGW